MHIRANVGACLSLKGELAQEHLRITYMQIIETTASLSKAVLLYSHMVSHGLIFSHLLKILYWSLNTAVYLYMPADIVTIHTIYIFSRFLAGFSQIFNI